MTGETPSIETDRRSVLKYTAAAAGTTAIGAAGIAGGETSTAAPATDWQRDYSGDETEYDISLATVQQSADGGYILAGSGAPMTATGPAKQQFAVVKADETGDQQWITFVDDESAETTELHCSSVTQTSDGGFAIVGYADKPAESADDHIGGLVAVAAKLGSGGAIEWTTTLDAFEDDEGADGSDAGHNDDASFAAVAPAGEDGGFVAGGDYEYDAWVVRFTGDGTVMWEQRTDERGIDNVDARVDGSHTLFATAETDGDDSRRVLAIDESGSVQRRETLDVDHTKTPYNHVFVPTTDGGYAYTGRDRDRENMVLGKLRDDGGRRWRSEYDGPYEGSDWAKTLVQTADGGYVLAGYMSEAYTGDSKPALVKTDGAGTEQWRRLFTDSTQHDIRDLVETADGGFAFLVHGNTLIRLEAADGATTPGDGEADTPADRDETGTEKSDDSPTTTPDGTTSPTRDECSR